jgi:hypothetical protein
MASGAETARTAATSTGLKLNIFATPCRISKSQEQNVAIGGEFRNGLMECSISGTGIHCGNSYLKNIVLYHTYNNESS